MEMKKIRADAMPVYQIVSLVELAQGIGRRPPEWERLKRKLAQYDAWGFFDREELVGYALVNEKCPYFGGSVQLVELRYRWQYNHEPEIIWMIQSLAGAYRGKAVLMVLDVNARRDINGGLYWKLGFQPTMMQSPLGVENSVLICEIGDLI